MLRGQGFRGREKMGVRGKAGRPVKLAVAPTADAADPLACGRRFSKLDLRKLELIHSRVDMARDVLVSK